MVPDYTVQATVADNCTSGAGILVTQDIAAGTVFTGEGTTQIITLTADDGNGNTTDCTLEITVDDNVPPTIACPPTQTQFTDANCLVSINDYTSLAVTDDNCTAMSMITVTQDPVPGTDFTGVQNVVVTLTADDGNGNTTPCTFSFFVRDNTPPQLTCPATQQETADTDCIATIDDYTGLATVTDNCSVLNDPGGNTITLEQTPPAGTTITGFDQSLTVTLTATDSSGNVTTCTFEVELVDEIEPTITCPDPQTLFPDADCNTAIIDYVGLAVAADNCDDATADLTYVQTPAPGLPLNGNGTTQMVNIEVTDRSGNSADCDFTVTVVDTISPTIVCPASPDTLSVDGACPVPLPDYTDQATVADNCTDAAAIMVTQVPAPGTTFMNDGTIIDVTLTADDGNGNMTSCTFQVELEDQTDPTLTCPGRQVLMTDASCQAIIPDYTALANASSPCGDMSMITLTQDPAPNTITLTGDSTVQLITIRAEDASGNFVECTFDVILVDDTDPVITACPADATVFVDDDCEIDLDDYRPLLDGTDNCEVLVDMVVFQSPEPGTTFSGDDTEVLVTFTLDDTNGNAVTCTSTVTLQDTTSPTIICPANQTVFTDANCEGTVPDYTDADVDDNCTVSADLVTTQVVTPGTLLSGFNDSEIVTLTVDDGNGNTSSCSFTVTLADDDPPTIACPPAQTIDSGTDCQFTIPDYRSLAQLGDNCAPNLLTVVQQPEASTILNDLNTAQEITLTVTDAGGNTARCAFTVTTVSATPPPASSTVTLALVAPPIGDNTVDLDDAFDPRAVSNLSNLDLDGGLDEGPGPFIVRYFASVADATAETPLIRPDGFAPDAARNPVVARIEDPSTGCFTLSFINFEQRTPGVSLAVDTAFCSRPDGNLKIDGMPRPGGVGTTIVRHQWRLVDPGTTGATPANLTQTDEQIAMLMTGNLRNGSLLLEYQFFEDYGDGPVVASVPELVMVRVLAVGTGDFFWDGRN